jgi:hypothetical protein
MMTVPEAVAEMTKPDACQVTPTKYCHGIPRIKHDETKISMA